MALLSGHIGIYFFQLSILTLLVNEVNEVKPGSPDFLRNPPTLVRRHWRCGIRT